VVVDVDPRHGGDDELDGLEEAHGKLPPTVTAVTGSGGRHYLFRRPSGVSFRAKPFKGIDIPNYIIAAPSTHPDTGRAYTWEASSRPLEVEPAELPAWLLARTMRIEVPDAFGQSADDAAHSFLALAFAHAGWLGRRIDSTRINCRCPWESEHTGRSGSGGTVIFAPKSGSGAGWFHCSHTSHGPKKMGDVLAALPNTAVVAASAQIAARAANDMLHDIEERDAIRGDGR
jgi:hypothetical protein